MAELILVLAVEGRLVTKENLCHTILWDIICLTFRPIHNLLSQIYGMTARNGLLWCGELLAAVVLGIYPPPKL